MLGILQFGSMPFFYKATFTDDYIEAAKIFLDDKEKAKKAKKCEEEETEESAKTKQRNNEHQSHRL